MTNESLKLSVMSANVLFHSMLSESYYKQPHYRQENKILVSARLRNLAERAGKNCLIDFGCGTGFVMQLAMPFFEKIYGIDITQLMMSKIKNTSGKIRLIKADTERVPIEDKSANVVSANSFLHHLWSVSRTLKEAYRLLKPGGVFYSEEDPNFYFWQAMSELNQNPSPGDLSEFLQAEMRSVLETHDTLGNAIGVDPEVVRMAEFQKMIRGGIKPEELERTFYETGFSKVNLELYWFLGQGRWMHQTFAEKAGNIYFFLTSVLPLSRHLFKYIRVEAWK